MGTSIKLLFGLLFAPALVVAQIDTSPTGISTSLGDGIRYVVPDYDADAIAYFIRAGVTDPTAKQQISDFVKGVKSLGLWSTMVCWPMRRSQNYGSGATVYSLGGLGTYDATLFNGPSWGSRGISITSTTQYAGTSLTTSHAYASFFAVFDLEATTVANLSFFNNQSGTAGFRLDINAGGWRVLVNNSTSAAGAYTGGVTSSLFARCTGSAVRFLVNTTEGFSGARTYNIGAAYQPLGMSTVSTSQSTEAFNAFFDLAVSDLDFIAFRNLYKATLGQGLGLP